MYIMARLSANNGKRIKALADKKGTTVASLSGAILAQWLNGELSYIKKEKRVRVDDIAAPSFSSDRAAEGASSC